MCPHCMRTCGASVPGPGNVMTDDRNSPDRDSRPSGILISAGKSVRNPSGSRKNSILKKQDLTAFRNFRVIMSSRDYNTV